MNKQLPTLMATAFIFVCSLSDLGAQTIDTGSNGSYGAINIQTNTTVILPLPPDGIFHCTTITLGTGATLKFSKNAANTPVYLLATGDISFGPSSTVDIKGQSVTGIAGGIGGPGGFDGGIGGDTPGDGHGPGGGKWGWTGPSPTYGINSSNLEIRGSAGHATRSALTSQAITAGSIYGNALLIPLIGGSGGGGGKAESLQFAYGGGGGGGAAIIASNTRIIFSTSGQSPSILSAEGGDGHSSETGNGSGGAFRLITPRVSGFVTTRLGPGGQEGTNLYGGFGRIRIDAQNIGEVTFTNLGGISPRSTDFITFGSNFSVFPPNFPTLRVTQVGTQEISLAQVTPVLVLFPSGSPATQTVTVSATNFNSIVPLRAVVTPQSGSAQSFDFTIDNTAGGTSTGTVDVQIPAGVASRIDVWTR